MAQQLKWNGKEFERRLKKATSQGLLRAGTFYQMKCREAVNKPNTGVRVPVRRRTPGGNRRSRTIYPNSSKPGESPRVRTGFGRNNIVLNHKSGANPHARVGVTANAIYMFYLEIGTRRVARRPWLLKTLYENQQVIGMLAATGGNKK